MALLSTACNQNATRRDTASQNADIVCKEPRPEICTMEYMPVCGVLSDNAEKTYASGCTACSHPEVSGYRKDACKLTD